MVLADSQPDALEPLGPEPSVAFSSSLERYLVFIDRARKTVVAAMLLCGIGCVICVNRDDYLRITLQREPDIWTWGAAIFSLALHACLFATLLLLVEYVARPVPPVRFRLWPLLFRTCLILLGLVGIGVLFGNGYGFGQGIGAVISLYLLLAAVQECHLMRKILVGVAVVLLGAVLWSTQSTYQYAHRHADEIVAAAAELTARCPAESSGEEIPVEDQRVSPTLRNLGIDRIWVDHQQVSLHVPGRFFINDREFIVLPDGETGVSAKWIQRFRDKDGFCRINDRLWMTDY